MASTRIVQKQGRRIFDSPEPFYVNAYTDRKRVAPVIYGKRHKTKQAAARAVDCELPNYGGLAYRIRVIPKKVAVVLYRQPKSYIRHEYVSVKGDDRKLLESLSLKPRQQNLEFDLR